MATLSKTGFITKEHKAKKRKSLVKSPYDRNFWFLVKSSSNKGVHCGQVYLGQISFPQEYIGKSVSFQVVLHEDDEKKEKKTNKKITKKGAKNDS